MYIASLWSWALDDIREFWDGIWNLFVGIGRLPGILADTDSYRSFWEFISTGDRPGEIWGRALDHLQLVGFSMLAATIVAIAMGVLAHRVKGFAPFALGLASVLLTIPSLALFTIFIGVSFIGTGDRGPMIALFFYSLLPILRNTITGLNEVDSAVVESAKGMGMSSSQRLMRIEMPLAWPVIIVGIRVSMLFNMGLAAIATLVGGTGLGFFVRDGLRRLGNPSSIERLWIGVLFIVLLALVVDLVLAGIQKFTTPRGL